MSGVQDRCPECWGEDGEHLSNCSRFYDPPVAFKADPIAVVVYDFGSRIQDEPTATVFGPFGGWNEARTYASKLRPELEPMCVVMRDPSIWPEPEKAL